jgi:GT2 family glycosyltransferase/SAM-dependent methyltransferase
VRAVETNNLPTSPGTSEHDRWRSRRRDRWSGVTADAGGREWCLVEIGARGATPDPPPGLARLPTDDAAAAVEMFLEGRWSHAMFLRGGYRLDSLAPRIAQDGVGRSGADVLYADEDVLTLEGEHDDPWFKPAWSPERLLGQDYVGGLLIVSRAAAMFARQSGAPLGSVYGLAAAFVDGPLKTAHISEILSSRIEGKASVEAPSPAVLRAVAERRGFELEVGESARDGTRRIHWVLRDQPLASIVIASTVTTPHLERCLQSIAQRTSYWPYQVVVAANADGALPAAFPELALPGFNSKLIRCDGPFNYSHVNNVAASRADGTQLVFLNDDTVIETEDWLEQLLQLTQLPSIGLAGATLLGEDGKVQLAGVLLTDDAHGARVVGTGLELDDPGDHGTFEVVRETSAVSGACMCISRDHFDELGGFDTSLAVELSDVDLALRSQLQGRSTVLTPFARVTHCERASRGSTIHPDDHQRFRARWHRQLRDGDPYHSPHLSREIGREWSLAPWEPTELSRVYGLTRREDMHSSPERLVPETMPGAITAEHMARYRWATQWVAGRAVLDAGCGVGYGSLMLREGGAQSVTGIDLSADAIAAAIARETADVSFVVADVCRLPFVDGAYDAVVSFEAIEHVGDVETALTEMARVLTPRGLLVISSPNRGVYPGGNPYHVSELTPVELRVALEQRFENVRLYRQHPWWSTLICEDGDFAASSIESELSVVVSKLSAALPGDEAYTIAVASNAPLNTCTGAAVLTDMTLSPAVLLAAHLERSLAETRRQLAEQRATVSWRITKPLRSVKRVLRRLR